MSETLRRLPLACPIDGLALRSVDRTLVCERGHAYDVSRHGHVNLLPVQFKPSKDPGDDPGMVAARRRVLESGLFDAVTGAVAERLAALATPDTGDAPLLVDAGCGEGHHTRRFAERLAPSGTAVLGVDISKHAVLAAARRHPGVAGWAVANNKRLPVLPGRCTLVTSLFGFETWAPWAALQTEGQHVLVVDAGPRHLIELREAIYARVNLHDAPSDDEAVRAGYRRVGTHRVEDVRPGVTPTALADVLAMTPHGHRVTAEARRALERLDGTALTVDAVLRTYRRERAQPGNEGCRSDPDRPELDGPGPNPGGVAR